MEQYKYEHRIKIDGGNDIHFLFELKKTDFDMVSCLNHLQKIGLKKWVNAINIVFSKYKMDIKKAIRVNFKRNHKIANIELTQELVRSKFDYLDGKLYSKKSKKQVGFVGDMGYFMVSVGGRTFKVHRVIFLWHNGYLPKTIDHKDMDKLNNNIENLREATTSQNAVNRIKNKNKSSKYLGVSKCNGKYHVICRKDGEKHFGGNYINEDDAALAFNKLAFKLHGEFARLNII